MKRRSFTLEQKNAAKARAIEIGVTQAAAALSISRRLLQKWRTTTGTTESEAPSKSGASTDRRSLDYNDENILLDFKLMHLLCRASRAYPNAHARYPKRISRKNVKRVDRLLLQVSDAIYVVAHLLYTILSQTYLSVLFYCMRRPTCRSLLFHLLFPLIYHSSSLLSFHSYSDHCTWPVESFDVPHI